MRRFGSNTMRPQLKERGAPGLNGHVRGPDMSDFVAQVLGHLFDFLG